MHSPRRIFGSPFSSGRYKYAPPDRQDPVSTAATTTANVSGASSLTSDNSTPSTRTATTTTTLSSQRLTVGQVSHGLRVRFSAIFDRDSSTRALQYQRPVLAERGYSVQDEIGSGGQGAVVSALAQDGQEVAIKIVPITRITPRQRSTLDAEISILRSLDDHQNIVQFRESFEDDTYAYIVTELLTGGDLHDCLTQGRPFTEEEVLTVSKQVLEALVHLHRRGISHRDIKLENLVLSAPGDVLTSPIKLVDFGFAHQRREDGDFLVEDFPGTSNYEAPEIVLKRPHTPEQLDMWSLGICIFTMVTRHFPFQAREEAELHRAIVSSDPVFIACAWKSASAKTASLVSRLLDKEPSMRPTALETLSYVNDLLSCLQTPDCAIANRNPKEKGIVATARLLFSAVRLQDRLRKPRAR